MLLLLILSVTNSAISFSFMLCLLSFCDAKVPKNKQNTESINLN